MGRQRLRPARQRHGNQQRHPGHGQPAGRYHGHGHPAGCQYSLALTSTGQVLAWGLNNHGQFGNGTTAGSDVPVPVTMPGHAKVRAISAGGAHNLALVSKRKVLAWGANEAGELGDGRTGGASLTPVRVRLPRGCG